MILSEHKKLTNIAKDEKSDIENIKNKPIDSFSAIGTQIMKSPKSKFCDSIFSIDHFKFKQK